MNKAITAKKNSGFILISILILGMLFSLYTCYQLDKQRIASQMLIKQILDINSVLISVNEDKDRTSENFKKILGVFPSIQKDIEGNIINYYSNTIISKNKDNKGYIVKVSNIPARECIYIANKFLSTEKIMINEKEINTKEIYKKFPPIKPQLPLNYKGFFDKPPKDNSFNDYVEEKLKTICNQDKNILIFSFM